MTGDMTGTGHIILLIVWEAAGIGADIMTLGTGTHGLILHGIGAVHGITAAGMPAGTTRGTAGDGMIHGIMADITEPGGVTTTADGTEDGTLYGTDISMQTPGGVQGCRPVPTGYMPAGIPSGEESAVHHPFQETTLRRQQAPFPEEAPHQPAE